MRILFCNIGYMKYYKGSCDQDITYGGGSFVDMHGYGAEEFNFLPTDVEFDGKRADTYCLGFFETKETKKGKINETHIEKIEGGNETAESIDDVLVVFCAPKPYQKYTTVVGWYKHATVYRYYHECIFGGNDPEYGNSQYYNILAKAKNCVLLPVKERKMDVWGVPRRQTKASFGFGQANVWYAEGRKDNKYLDAFLTRIVDQIENYKGDNWIDEYPELTVDEAI